MLRPTMMIPLAFIVFLCCCCFSSVGRCNSRIERTTTMTDTVVVVKVVAEELMINCIRIVPPIQIACRTKR